MKKLKDVKPGEFFTLKPTPEPKESQVYIRDDYDRSERKYLCRKFSDVNAWRYLKGDRIVYTEFYF